MSYAAKIEAHYIEAKPKAEIDTNAMSSEYNEFPTEFLAHAKRNALVFIHTAATPEGRNLDDVLKGGQLGARAQLKDIVNKSLLVVNKIEPTTGAKMKKGAYVFVGVSGLKNGVANAYVHDIKGDSAYIGSMSSHLEK